MSMKPHSAEQSSLYKTEGRSADFEETPCLQKRVIALQEVHSAMVLLPAPRLITASLKLRCLCEGP